MKRILMTGALGQIGTDIIAQAVSKRFGIPSGTAIIIVDILIIIAAIPVFSAIRPVSPS